MEKLKTFLAFYLLLPLLTHAQPAAPLNMSYGPLIQFPAGARPSDVAVSDFDHDGRPDLAVTERGRDSLVIFKQLPGNVFPTRPSAQYYVPQAPATLVSIPLNGYGPSSQSPSPPADDIAVGCAQNSFFYLFDNTGVAPGVLSLVPRPHFMWQNGSSVPLANPRLVTGHFNSANYFDIGYLYDASTPRGLGGMAMLGNATSTPQPHIQYSTRVSGGANFIPVDFGLADIFTPGKYLDALLPSPATDEVIVILRGTPISYNASWWAPGSDYALPSQGSGPVSAAGADVNGDGACDLAVAHAGSFNVVVQLHDPTQADILAFSTTRLTYLVNGVPRKVILADLNRDNRPEMLVLLENGSLLIYRNTGQSGQGLFDLASGALLLAHAGATYMRLADVNLDGFPDILVTSPSDDAVSLFYSSNQAPLATAVAAKPAIQVYPNPAHHSFQVELPIGERASPLKLLDGLGRTVRQWQPGTTLLSVENLPRGVYILRVELAAGPVTRRVVLE